MRSQRLLRTAFVVTLSTLASTACEEKKPYEPIHENPPPLVLQPVAVDAGPPPAPPAPPGVPVDGHPPTDFHTINPPGLIPFDAKPADGGT